MPFRESLSTVNCFITGSIHLFFLFRLNVFLFINCILCFRLLVLFEFFCWQFKIIFSLLWSSNENHKVSWFSTRKCAVFPSLLLYSHLAIWCWMSFNCTAVKARCYAYCLWSSTNCLPILLFGYHLPNSFVFLIFILLRFTNYFILLVDLKFSVKNNLFCYLHKKSMVSLIFYQILDVLVSAFLLLYTNLMMTIF